MSAGGDQNGVLNESSSSVVSHCSCHCSSGGISPPAEWRRNGILTDVTLVAKAFGGTQRTPKEVRIPAHKLILAMHSDYFRRKFEHDVTSSELVVPTVDPDNLMSLVKFIYRETVLNVEEANVERLYIDADFLNINDARQTCLDYMHRNINASNWAKRLKFCRQTTLKELGRLVNEYVSTDYLACLKSTHFESLNVFEVIAFLRLPARCSCPEHEILLHLLNWVRRNQQERASYTAIVLKELNLAALPEQLLHHYFTTEPLLNRYDTNRLYKMALMKKTGHSGRASEGSKRSVIRPVARASLQTVQQAQAVPSENIEVQVNQVTNGTGGAKLAIAASTAPPAESSTASPNKRSALVSVKSPCLRSGDDSSSPRPEKIARHYSPDPDPTNGTNNCDEEVQLTPTSGDATKKFVMYIRQSADDIQILATDLENDATVWEVGRHTGIKSPQFLWIASQRRLYALGGLKRGRCSSDVTFTFTNLSNENTPLTWFKASPMKSSRINFQPVVLENYIYAFGGSKFNEPQVAISTAERLSLEDNSLWEEIANMQVPRECFGACVLNGKIFVCGGYGGPNHVKSEVLNSAECYDPRSNQWEQVAQMARRRIGLSCVVLNGKLYAIGGTSDQESSVEDRSDIEVMKSVEMYEPEKDTWTTVATLNRPRTDACAVALRGKIFVIGGDRSVAVEQNQILSSVEFYDPDTDKWELSLDALDDEGIFNSFVVTGDNGDD